MQDEPLGPRDDEDDRPLADDEPAPLLPDYDDIPPPEDDGPEEQEPEEPGTAAQPAAAPAGLAGKAAELQRTLGHWAHKGGWAGGWVGAGPVQRAAHALCLLFLNRREPVSIWH